MKLIVGCCLLTFVLLFVVRSTSACEIFFNAEIVVECKNGVCDRGFITEKSNDSGDYRWLAKSADNAFFQQVVGNLVSLEPSLKHEDGVYQIESQLYFYEIYDQNSLEIEKTVRTYEALFAQVKNIVSATERRTQIARIQNVLSIVFVLVVVPWLIFLKSNWRNLGKLYGLIAILGGVFLLWWSSRIPACDFRQTSFDYALMATSLFVIGSNVWQIWHLSNVESRKERYN